MIRLLIADDTTLVADAWSAGMSHHGIEVVACVHRPEEVVPVQLAVKADVVLLDYDFGHTATLNGFQVAREVLQTKPEARVIIYSQIERDEQVSGAYRLGAAAFIPKSTPRAKVIEAVKRVHSDGVYFLPDVAERLALLKVHGDTAPQVVLDARELEVFCLMASGRTREEIAEQLNHSAKTITGISQAIRDKLNVQRQADLTKLAIRHGLLVP